MLHRLALDKDLFFDSAGDVYQVITSIHPNDRVVALRKYFYNAQEPKESFYWQSPQWPGYYTRGIPSYNVDNASQNIISSPYSRHSLIFGVPMIEVPLTAISYYFYPEEGIREFLAHDTTNPWTRTITDIVTQFEDQLGLARDNLGLTGSLLWGGQHENSDIDIVVYGIKATRAFLRGIPELLENSSHFTPPPPDFITRYGGTLAGKTGLPDSLCEKYITLKKYYVFFDDRFLSIGFVPLPAEVIRQYDQYTFRIISPATVTARIIDDSRGYFYPAEYTIEVASIDLGDSSLPTTPPSELTAQITTYLAMEREISGYFFPGDEVEISGLLEEVWDGDFRYYQLLTGTQEMLGHEYVKRLD